MDSGEDTVKEDEVSTSLARQPSMKVSFNGGGPVERQKSMKMLANTATSLERQKSSMRAVTEAAKLVAGQDLVSTGCCLQSVLCKSRREPARGQGRAPYSA